MAYRLKQVQFQQMPKETCRFQNHAPGRSPSSTTTAIAISRACVKLNDVRLPPNARINSAARPLQCRIGRCPGSLHTSISIQLTPRLIPVPSAFAPASLAANRAAKLSAGRFFRRQYAISPGVKIL